MGPSRGVVVDHESAGSGTESLGSKPHEHTAAATRGDRVPQACVAEKSPLALIALRLIALALPLEIVRVCAAVGRPIASVPKLNETADSVMPPVSVDDVPRLSDVDSEGDVGGDL